MKKALSIIAGMSMLLSLVSCSEATKETSSEEQVETTTTTTSLTTETTTVEVTTIEKIILDKEYTFKDLTFSVPKSANKEFTMPYNDSELTLINFKDTSEIQVAVTPNSSGTAFSSVSEAQLYDVLEAYASSFSKSGDVSSEKTKISDSLAIRQSVKDKGSISTNIHVIYNETIYTVSFFDSEGKTDTTAPMIADDVINSFSFKKSELPTEKTTDKPTEPPTTKPNISKGQENALKQAKSYISHSAFSYNELIEQLEYEKYSHDEAVYGADNCGADWNAEALEQAKSYISHSAFSYSELYDQLIYGQFTSEQAQYGVDNCGADWNAEAVEQAESYLSHSSFSREELYDQLIYEGFTPEQAEHGVSAVY